jgi:hypothetical protein
MKIFNYVFLCGLLIGFSCQKNITTEISGEPDKTIKDITGILCYSNESKMWGVRYGYPGTIDNVDIYLIKNSAENFHFVENKKVKISGDCYLTDALFPVPAGTTVYYIIIANLAYE